MIQNKEIEPLIVVAPTFYDDDENIGENRMDDTIASGVPTPNANIRFSMKQEGQHYYGDINGYLYYCLPLLFK